MLRDAFGIIGHAVRSGPRLFAFGAASSTVYVATTVLFSAVLGRVTDQVIAPAFRDGEVSHGALAVAFLVILGVTVPRAAATASRRMCSGLLQFRVHANSRRRV